MAWSDIIQAQPVIPAALGAELEPYPYLSGFGLLQRITHLTTCSPSQVAGLGFRNRNTVDVLLATQRFSKSRDLLLNVLGLQATPVARYWAPETWCPLQTQDLFRRQPRPVWQCPACWQHGYHCALFQLPSIVHCPWHGVPLQQHCPQCGQRLHARFSQSGRVGLCACGYDRFDPVQATVHMWTFPGAKAEAWIDDYLAWAARRRYSRWFCAPLSNPDWDAGFAALAAPPSRLQKPLTLAPGQIEVFCGVGADPAPRQFWGWSSWGSERPLTLAPLPATMYPKLCQATQDIADRLPRESRTPFDLVDANNLHARSTLQENISNRPDCFVAPRGHRGAAAWLNLSVVDAGTAAFCGQVLDQVKKCLGAAPDLPPHSLQVERSDAIDPIQGRRHLSFALESMLIRAYRQGLEATLRSKLNPPDQMREPWVLPTLELVGRPGQLRSVRMCWTAIRRPVSQRSEHLRDTPSSHLQPEEGAKSPLRRLPSVSCAREA